MDEKEILLCKKCGHKWKRRVDNPSRCPECYNTKWWNERVRYIIRKQAAQEINNQMQTKKMEGPINNKLDEKKVVRFD